MTTTTCFQVIDRHRHPNLFTQVLNLGQRYKKTLGFLPKGSFEEYADKRGLLAHVSVDGKVNGYVLFRRSGTPQQIWIVHLCVDERARRQGVATQIIKELTRLTQQARGIGLHCRTEYDANQMWPLLDFRPVSRKRGRGKDEAELIFWWRDHGHPTLFSLELDYLESAAIRAVLDANVLFDLTDPSRPYHEEAMALKTEWLQPFIEYSISPEIHLEIHRQLDPIIKRRSQQAAATFLQVPVNTDDIKTRALEIRKRLGWSDTDNNRGDAHHLAYTSLSNCRYFITRDENILASADILEEEFSVIVLLPRQFALRFDELQREDQYRPVGVGDTQFRMRRLAQEDTQRLYTTFRQDHGTELKKDFEQRVAARLAHPDQYYNTLYEDQAGKALVFTSTGALSDEFQMEFFRTVKHPLTLQLARYALNRFILKAAQSDRWVVSCTDSQRSETARAALSALRFSQVPKHGMVKLVPPIVGSPEEVAEELRAHLWRTAELQRHAEYFAESVEKAAELPLEWLPQVEQALWPAKILHQQIGNFVVPIKPTWARRLFDEGIAGLYSGREHEKLLLNWENVYYSKARRQRLMRPGSHILWYVSSESGYTVSALRACSTIEEVQVGTARDLYAQFKRLGVYRLSDLQGMSGPEDQPLLAMRFTRTELFPQPIKLEQHSEIRRSLGLGAPAIYSPTQISEAEFKALYAAGNGRF